MELSLQFSVKYDLELLEKGITLPIIRLIGVIEFKHEGQWSRPYDVIIDTSSPKIPLILGFADVLENCDLIVSYPQRKSHLIRQDEVAEYLVKVETKT